jgi:hypothetical protein
MSGSRGEANFVWKCQFCKVCKPGFCLAWPISIEHFIEWIIERVICNNQGSSYPISTSFTSHSPEDLGGRLPWT